jgi:hypothetical protein
MQKSLKTMKINRKCNEASTIFTTTEWNLSGDDFDDTGSLRDYNSHRKLTNKGGDNSLSK